MQKSSADQQPTSLLKKTEGVSISAGENQKGDMGTLTQVGARPELKTGSSQGLSVPCDRSHLDYTAASAGHEQAQASPLMQEMASRVD